LTEEGLVENNFEERLYQLIVSLDSVKIEELLSSLEKKLREIIIIRKVLLFLTEEKVLISLEEIKEKINIIENNKDHLSEAILTESIEVCNKKKSEIDFELKSEIDKNQKLLLSWEKINNVFGYKTIAKEHLPKFRTEFLDLMKLNNNISSNLTLPEIITQIENDVKNYLKKKQKYSEKILHYLQEFSDISFIERLIEGNSLMIKELQLEMFKQLQTSELKDKIVIKLK